jgi:hypothetical protein
MRLNLLKQSSYKMGGYVTGFPGEDARNCKTYVVDSLLSKGGIFDGNCSTQVNWALQRTKSDKVIA